MAACEFRNCDYTIIDKNTPILTFWNLNQNGIEITLKDQGDIGFKPEDL